jgi:hypothetical protein
MEDLTNRLKQSFTGLQLLKEGGLRATQLGRQPTRQASCVSTSVMPIGRVCELRVLVSIGTF